MLAPVLKSVCSGLLLLALLAVSAHASQPELSADEPIAFDAREQTLTARGNARLVDRDTVFEADEIIFHRRDDRVVATGNVRVSQPGFRLITNRLVYDTATRRFEVERFRAGYPPLFVEGDAFEGTREEIDFSRGTLYLNEPEPQSLRVAAESGRIEPGDRFRVSGPSLRVGRVPAIPLPSFQRSVEGAAPLDFRGEIGYRQNLGAFGRSAIVAPVGEKWGAGANFDLYSNRGVLFGPILRYQTEGEGGDSLFAELSTGFIRDESAAKRGTDFLGAPVPRDRAFADAAVRQRSGPWRTTARATAMRDSETHRDFRPDRYDEAQQPDSFLETLYLADNWVASLFARANFNRYHPMVERLPELRFDYLPTPVGETGFLQTAELHFLNYRRQSLEAAFAPPVFAPFLDFGIPPEGGIGIVSDSAVTRLGGAWRIEHPLALARWLHLRPLAGARFTFFDAGRGPREGRGAHYWRGELGFDLTAQAHAEWDVQSRTWGIEGIRHIVRPVLRYRWQPVDGDPTTALPGYDAAPFLPTLPTIDLMDDRALDSAEERHVLRFGLENLLQTRGEAGAARSLARLNLYQDLVLSNPAGTPDWEATYLQFETTPARWLHLEVAQRFRTESPRLDETRFLAHLRSAERWRLTLSADYLNGFISQYAVDGYYQLNPRFGLLAGARYDERLDRMTRHYYGIRQRLGRSWEIEYSVIFNEGTTREDDFQVGLRVFLHTF